MPTRDCHVLEFCDCARSVDKRNKIKDKKVLTTCLNVCNKSYGIHFFAKHKDLLTTALEALTSFNDKPTITMKSDILKKNENIIPCFECKRLFYDTVINDYKGTATGFGKNHLYKKELKFQLHEEHMNCTPETRLKALHKFICFESGSEVLKAKLTEEQKMGLIDDRKPRGRPPKIKGAETSTPTETIKLVELPADSAEIERLKAEIEELKADLKEEQELKYVYRIGFESYERYMEHICSHRPGGIPLHTDADRARENRKYELIDEYAEKNLINDTDEFRDLVHSMLK